MTKVIRVVSREDFAPLACGNRTQALHSVAPQVGRQ